MNNYTKRLFIFSSLFASSALAQTNNLDYTQDVISKNLFSATNRIDTYFGDQKVLEEKNGSYIKLEYVTSIREQAVQTSQPDFEVKVRFKQLEKKLNFKFTSEHENQDKTLQNQENTEETKDGTAEESILRASIGFLRQQEKDWSLFFDTGIRIEAQLNPFAKFGGRRSFYFGKNELGISNKTLVEEVDGMFNDTSINLNRKLSQDFSFTYANLLVWEDKLGDFTTVHGPTISQIIDDKQSISYNIRTRFSNRSRYAITGHEVYSSYKRDLYKKWIYLYLTPGISFVRETEFSRSGFFTAKIQTLFGDY